MDIMHYHGWSFDSQVATNRLALTKACCHDLCQGLQVTQGKGLRFVSLGASLVTLGYCDKSIFRVVHETEVPRNTQ